MTGHDIPLGLVLLAGMMSFFSPCVLLISNKLSFVRQKVERLRK